MPVYEEHALPRNWADSRQPLLLLCVVLHAGRGGKEGGKSDER